MLVVKRHQCCGHGNCALQQDIVIGCSDLCVRSWYGWNATSLVRKPTPEAGHGQHGSQVCIIHGDMGIVMQNQAIDRLCGKLGSCKVVLVSIEFASWRLTLIDHCSCVL